MADVFAGCLLERVPSPKALARLPYFELAPRPPLPSFATLARIKKQAPAWPQVALVAPRNTWMTPQGAMRPGAELDAGLDWIKRASDILGAFAIVVATGAELSTGGRDRERLSAFLEQLKPTGRTLVVAPRGLWDPEHATPFAAEHGAVYGFDPLEHDAPEGDLLYARVRPMGARPRLTEGHIAQIAERVLAAGAERAYVSIESDQCSRAAKRLLGLVQELGDLPPDEDEEDDDEQDEQDEEDEEDGEESEDDED